MMHFRKKVSAGDHKPGRGENGAHCTAGPGLHYTLHRVTHLSSGPEKGLFEDMTDDEVLVLQQMFFGVVICALATLAAKGDMVFTAIFIGGVAAMAGYWLDVSQSEEGWGLTDGGWGGGEGEWRSTENVGRFGKPGEEEEEKGEGSGEWVWHEERGGNKHREWVWHEERGRPAHNWRGQGCSAFCRSGGDRASPL
ncbi:hypothetical protein JZ751_010090 [Albula glossodonta]|uniref:Uncharacterized protein n=1 Tax=Albula glossodonta TaxID=121402 RepID=A0A8T2N5H3_9TELE|nr:hypothetical protein JZ751_010090 [Albula glossodonta]